MSQSNTPHYKTLDIVKFYDEVYDFVSRYLIFVLAGVFAVIATLIIWIREPDTVSTVVKRTSTGSDFKGYIQETGLIYPVHYFAEESLNLDGNSKIFGLGGPVWSSIEDRKKMWNSIDNIVQYNGVILPRQISRSAWVPKLQQEYYSESMIITFLEGMGTSTTDVSLVQNRINSISKTTISSTLFETFGIACVRRSLVTTKFCDLKLSDTIPTWSTYDLSSSTEELNKTYHYIFDISQDAGLKKSWCNAMIQQYRYSAAQGLQGLVKQCDKSIVDEVQFISDMAVVNTETKDNQYTNTVYKNPIINRYKLMSRYQYLMTRIEDKQFNDDDAIILYNYNSYIASLTHKGTVIQPYGDIISVFHQQKLMPRLNDRESFAKSNEKQITQELADTTALIINGNPQQGIVSILSGSRLKPIDFLQSQGLYYDNSGHTGFTNTQISPSNMSTGSSLGTTNTGSTTIGATTTPSINTLIAQVLGTEPASVEKRGQLIIIKYNYNGKSWLAAVNLNNKGITQIFYDSPISGATKITHQEVIFNASNTQLIMKIMNDYLSKNPS